MDTPWHAHYPAGVPARVNTAVYTSVVEMFEHACRRHAGKTAFICMNSRISFEYVGVLTQHFAAWLQSQGFTRGDRIALMMANCLQYPIAFFGALKAGCIIVTCQPGQTRIALEQKLNDAQVKGIVIGEDVAHLLTGAALPASLRHCIVTRPGEMLRPLKERLADVTHRHVHTEEWALPGHIRMKQALKEGSRLSFTPLALAQADLACLQYTGGTTGPAKGVLLSHANLLANLLQLKAYTAPLLSCAETHPGITALPLAHILALTCNLLLLLQLGITNLLITDGTDTHALVRELKRHPFSYITGTSRLYHALLEHPDAHGIDFSRLRLSIAGAMAVTPRVATRWQALSGVPLTQGYGLTEAAPAVSLMPSCSAPVPFNGAVGLPLPSTEVSIRDAEGHEVARNEPGELCLRGPQLFVGYWQPACTGNDLRPWLPTHQWCSDGFFRTGDIARMDDQGYIRLLHRKRELIQVAGFLVHPGEVEEVALKHPGVVEAAAIGMPDEATGERVKLYIIARDTSLSSEELKTHCQQSLSTHKVPRVIEFRQEFPRNSLGKILKHELLADFPEPAPLPPSCLSD